MLVFIQPHHQQCLFPFHRPLIPHRLRKHTCTYHRPMYRNNFTAYRLRRAKQDESRETTPSNSARKTKSTVRTALESCFVF
ncbi:hypothetical protein HETIRDRAFT_387501 [Heterobasidion irregulare TC 32-1]|uniref:Uncharacterized protein n=1 Tax=Heterobasidion irregulare (strain TC 32-1) TaxID=747525 RepID=W4K0C4_HETIT|nr:uncharacterized protein HETIRDRAFT_387501 [Heterobasidion irregulare TC 32-1]ETW79184.1 hypothetical protein HETIRDRAFT_387501 [Heterobasidion irregulare TC 32-1]